MSTPSPVQWQRREDIVAALQFKRIAVVGLSPNPSRDSNEVARYMLAHGYEIVPVNPNASDILGLPCYPSLRDIPEPVDIVDVFRDSSAVPGIVEDTLNIGAPFLWLQLGVIHIEAVKAAASGGVRCIVDRCIKVEHVRHLASKND